MIYGQGYGQPGPQQDYGQFQPPEPQPPRRRRSRVPLFSGAAVVLVIAGGGTAYALAGDRGASSPAAGTVPRATAKPASLAQLNKVMLQPADFSPGWKGKPFRPAPEASADNAVLTKCTGVSSTDSDKVAEADSETFTLGSAVVTSSASSYRSQGDIDSDTATLRSPGFSSCFEQMLRNQLASDLPAGASIGSASVKVTPGPDRGPAGIVATSTATFKITANGRQIPMYLTSAFIMGPLIEAEVDTVDVSAHVPASEANRLVATVAARAARA